MEVRVYNDSIHPYKEKFREELIEIPPKGFIKMDSDIAVMFKGSFTPVVLDGGGAPDPKYFKMLRIVKEENAPVEKPKDENICHQCAKHFPTPVSLDQHITDEHAHLIADEDEREKRIAKKTGTK